MSQKGRSASGFVQGVGFQPLAEWRGTTILGNMMGRMIAAGLLALLSAVSLADQNDPRLDGLFAQLRGATDAAEAERLSAEIWRIWRQTGDLEAAEAMREGLLAMEEERYQDALASFNALISVKPEFAEAWNRRATLYFLIGEFGRSVTDIQQVLQLEPRHFGALAGLGLIYMQLGEDRAAISTFEQALKINPHLVGARANIDHIRRRMREKTI